jgi:selenocysteine-specific elongation factor
MSVVVGTAGHIDHGKTSLLRALTGIDADRLPEERRRGMTIDVGYAHLALADGEVLDFVDVPGHDRLVGNMLVGAGEVDAAMLVVAADDGPRAQTLEHLELLDALGIAAGLAVVTKADLLAPDDPRRAELVAEVAALLARTSLAGSPILLASSASGEGLDGVRLALAGLRDRVRAAAAWRAAQAGPPRLAVDRAFGVRGRGRVVTGTLRGGALAPGARLHVVPGGGTVRVREIQARGGTVAAAVDGGRVALNVAGDAAAAVARGAVLVAAVGGADAAPAARGPRDLPGTATRLLVALRPSPDLARPGRTGLLPADGETVRMHLATAQADATVRRSRADLEREDGTRVTRLSLAAPIAAAAGDRFALRRPSPGGTAGGGIVLDPSPPSGPSRRHMDPAGVPALLDAVLAGDAAARDAALLALHGAVPADVAGDGERAAGVVAGPVVLSGPVAAMLRDAAVAAVAADQAARPDAPGLPVAELRRALARALRRRVAVSSPDAAAAAAAIVDALLAAGDIARDGDVVRDPAREAGPPPALAAAMDRLEAALATPTPPAFADAVRAAGCPPEGVRVLERSGRIVRLDADLAFAATAYHRLAATALAMARRDPLTPAAFRDATGSSRKYALAILEDLDRRQILRRGPDGHVPGPRAPSARGADT